MIKFIMSNILIAALYKFRKELIFMLELLIGYGKKLFITLQSCFKFLLFF